MAPGLLQPRPGRPALTPHGGPQPSRFVLPVGVSGPSRPGSRLGAAAQHPAHGRPCPGPASSPAGRSSTCPAPPPGPGRPGSGGPGTGGILPWRRECPSDTRASPAPVGASGLWLGAGSLVTPSPSGWSVTGSAGTISARGRAVAEQVTPGACSRVQPGEQLQTPTGVLDRGWGRGGASRDLPAFALTAGLMPALPDPPCPRPSSPCPHASPRLPVCTQLPAGTWAAAGRRPGRAPGSACSVPPAGGPFCCHGSQGVACQAFLPSGVPTPGAAPARGLGRAAPTPGRCGIRASLPAGSSATVLGPQPCRCDWTLEPCRRAGLATAARDGEQAGPRCCEGQTTLKSVAQGLRAAQWLTSNRCVTRTGP